jgi:hypothetical protein
MRIVIPAVWSLALGGQVLLSSFFLSVLSLGRGEEQPKETHALE